MLRAESNQLSFYGSHVYDRVIPEDHFLKCLNRVVDFSFVSELCRDAYALDLGHSLIAPSVDRSAIWGGLSLPQREGGRQ